MNKMTENYLITGYWGEPHVTAENDRGINAAIFGAGRFVLPVGEKFRAEYMGNNTIRIYDGKLMDNGAAAGIPAGSYVDLLIANAGQGMKRSDIIAFQYSQDASTLVESGSFVVIQGTETSGTAADPALTQNDLLEGDAAFDQMPLYRVPVSGTTISAPVKLFATSKSIADLSGGETITPDDIGAAYEVSKLTPSGGVASLTLADNTEYRFSSAVTSLTINFPSGAFDCWLRFTAGSVISVVMPTSAKYIGGVPEFEASKTYEMSIKDGIVACSEVTEE